MVQVVLRRPAGTRLARIREITGCEEQSICNTTTVDAIALLQRLLVTDHYNALAADEVGGLTSWERDRLLAALYIRVYGPRVVSTMKCQGCEALFDVNFILQTLMDEMAPEDSSPSVEDHIYVLRNNIQFHLPTGDDECAVFGLPPQRAEAELLERCLVGSKELDAEMTFEVQRAMEKLSPVVNTELDAKCPECGHEQTFQFDLQRFMLTALINDRRQLVQEIHILASAYGWGLSEILNLARSQRRMFVALVDANDALQKVRNF